MIYLNGYTRFGFFQRVLVENVVGDSAWVQFGCRIFATTPLREGEDLRRFRDKNATTMDLYSLRLRKSRISTRCT